MNRRLLSVMRAGIVLAVLVLPLTLTSRVAQACGRCGQACCPSYQVVQRTECVPTMVPQTRVVCATEYRCEVRERPVTVCRCVPETRQVRQTYTVMVPHVQTREVTCTVAVPVWDEVEQTYTVMVPHQEVRHGTRRVCRPVQVQEMRTVCRDLGHCEEVTCYKRCAALRWSCGWAACSGCAPVACYTQMVWVPNIVTEQVPVTVTKYEAVDEPCEYTVTVCKPEQRVCKVKVCRYVNQQRVQKVQCVTCVPEQRERVCNVTTYRQVTEQVMQKCTVMVPYTVQKQVTVMVCQMVPRQVYCKVPVRCCN